MAGFKTYDDKKQAILFVANNHSVQMLQSIKLSLIVRDKNDFGRCHLMAENLYKDMNFLAVRESTRSTRYADINDLASMVGLSSKKTREFISRMKKLHIMAECKQEVGDKTLTKFVLNPLFFKTNKWLSTELYFMFQESIDPFISEDQRYRMHGYDKVRQGTLRRAESDEAKKRLLENM